MGRKQNYGFQKRQKEIEKQKKRDEKAEKKRARKEADEQAGEDGGEDAEDGEPPGAPTELSPELRARLDALCDEGWEIWDRFDAEVRQQSFHPFVAADYRVVLDALIPLRAPGLRFLEWGSATGVITIMADLLGFEAYGIELDRVLVDQARDLAHRTASGARFTTGSFLPTGYRWKDRQGDSRLGTIGSGDSGYLEMGRPLEDFDVVFGYPWAGEEPMMVDLMKVHGRAGARLLLHTGGAVQVHASRA